MLEKRQLDHERPVFRGAHARYAAYAARACGYAFRSLDGEDGYLFEVRDGARRAAFAAGAGSPYGLNDVRAASIARDKFFCAEVLRQADAPVLDGRLFFVTRRYAEMRTPGREPDDARAFAEVATYPLFAKPLSASNGLHAEVIENAGAFTDYMTRVAHEHFAIIVQPYVRAPEHRVFVLNGRALFSYRKVLPTIVGDGRSTVAELIAALPRDEGVAAPARLARDESGRRVALERVLPAGMRATLEGPANRAAGGGASALRDGAPLQLEALALRAADVVGLRLAAIDIFDISCGGDLGSLAIIEVNSNPMIATLEENGRWDLIEQIWRANFDAALR